MTRSIALLILIASAAPSFAANTATLNYNGIACQNAEDISQGIRIGESGDQEAYIKHFGPLIESGSCIMLQQGDQVFLDDISMFSGTACVRPRGEPKCFTIEYEAIQGK